MRLIDADALRITNITERKHIFIDGKRRSTFVYGEVVRIKDLQNATTIDAVPVVRCKDCVFYDKPGCAIYIVDDSDKPKEADYCSFGERKDDGA